MTDEADRAAILECEAQRCKALTSGDISALAAIVSDDLIHIHGNGHIDGKSEYLKGIKEKYIFHSLERGELAIRIYGDVAVVVGPLEQRVEVRDPNQHYTLKGLSTQTWVRSDQGWRQNTCHMHFMPAA